MQVFGTPMNADATPMNADEFMARSALPSTDAGEHVAKFKGTPTHIALSAFIGVASAFIGDSKTFAYHDHHA